MPLKDLKVAIPAKQEQEEIVRCVKTMFDFAGYLEARLISAQAAAGKQFPVLLAKSFRGELALEDPCDEPAS